LPITGTIVLILMIVVASIRHGKEEIRQSQLLKRWLSHLSNYRNQYYISARIKTMQWRLNNDVTFSDVQDGEFQFDNYRTQ